MEHQVTPQERRAAKLAAPSLEGGPTNGGFPEPVEGVAVRVLRAEHGACGRETRMRLPAAVPAEAVRRVVCQGCANPYDAANVEDVGIEEAIPPDPPSRRSLRGGPLPLPALPQWLRDPRGRAWRYLSIPVAAVAVIGALVAIQGADEPDAPFSAPTPPPAAPAPAPEPGTPPASEPAGAASLIRESSFTLALPAGWERRDAEGGATFSAATADGSADVALWVERAPGLSVAEFESRSLDQLEALAGSSRVVDRVAGPTPEETIVRLAADAPAGSASYEVTLRSSGPLRYYLATTVQPGAPRQAATAAELIHGSFLPTGERG